MITVGAADVKQTAERQDDDVAPFSSRGPTQDGLDKPNLVAPGTTIVATRDVGGTIDQLHPDAVVDESYFKGTGTSQAGAIVSGVAALMYQVNPDLHAAPREGHPARHHVPAGRVPRGRRPGLVDAAGAVWAPSSRSPTRTRDSSVRPASAHWRGAEVGSTSSRPGRRRTS